MNRIRNGVKYYKYDIKEHNFVSLLCDLFKIDNLSLIHEKINNLESLNVFTNDNDDKTVIHEIFYKRLNSGWQEFEQTYQTFIEHNIKNVFNVNEIIYQSKPTFRVHLPGNIAVGGSGDISNPEYGWHKDTDPEYNHPPFEKNFIIPITNASENSSVYIETKPGSNEFHSADMVLGEYFQFNGGYCRHGNKINDTEYTRVSFDFRIVLPDDYSEDYIKESKLSSKKFIIGEYYEKL